MFAPHPPPPSLTFARPPSRGEGSAGGSRPHSASAGRGRAASPTSLSLSAAAPPSGVSAGAPRFAPSFHSPPHPLGAQRRSSSSNSNADPMAQSSRPGSRPYSGMRRSPSPYSNRTAAGGGEEGEPPRLTLMQRAALRVRERQRQGIYSESLREFAATANAPNSSTNAMPSLASTNVSNANRQRDSSAAFAFAPNPFAAPLEATAGGTSSSLLSTSNAAGGGSASANVIVLRDLLHPSAPAAGGGGGGSARRRRPSSDPPSAIEVRRQSMAASTPLSPHRRNRSNSVASSGGGGTPSPPSTALEQPHSPLRHRRLSLPAYVCSPTTAVGDGGPLPPSASASPSAPPLSFGGIGWGENQNQSLSNASQRQNQQHQNQTVAHPQRPPPFRGTDVVMLPEEVMRRHSGYGEEWVMRVAKQHSLLAQHRALKTMRRVHGPIVGLPAEERRLRGDVISAEASARQYLFDLYRRRTFDLSRAVAVRNTIRAQTKAVIAKHSRSGLVEAPIPRQKDRPFYGPKSPVKRRRGQKGAAAAGGGGGAVAKPNDNEAVNTADALTQFLLGPAAGTSDGQNAHTGSGRSSPATHRSGAASPLFSHDGASPHGSASTRPRAATQGSAGALRRRDGAREGGASGSSLSASLSAAPTPSMPSPRGERGGAVDSSRPIATPFFDTLAAVAASAAATGAGEAASLDSTLRRLRASSMPANGGGGGGGPSSFTGATTGGTSGCSPIGGGPQPPSSASVGTRPRGPSQFRVHHQPSSLLARIPAGAEAFASDEGAAKYAPSAFDTAVMKAVAAKK